ncbi:MAG: DUF6687 family protein [Acidimicrobiales bacterium]
MSRTSRHWEFIAAADMGDRPHIVVDGAGTRSSVLTLSHWPHTSSPTRWAHDTSTGIVFNFLAGRARWWSRRPGPEAGAVACTNDHFDQDGLAGLFALGRPGQAWAQRARLEDLARAGDFATYLDRDAARVSFTVAALADPQRTTLDAALLAPSPGGLAGRLYPELLGRLPEILDRLEALRDLWGEEDSALECSEKDLASGRITMEEDPGLDLVVVRLPEGAPARRATRFAGPDYSPVHPAAVHRASPALRVLLMGGGRYQLSFRYESWVRLARRRGLPRVDMAPAVAELNAAEEGGAQWSFNGAAALVARLTVSPHSSLSPDHVLECIRRHLSTAAVAWDPYQASPGPALAQRSTAPKGPASRSAS